MPPLAMVKLMLKRCPGATVFGIFSATKADLSGETGGCTAVGVLCGAAACVERPGTGVALSATTMGGTIAWLEAVLVAVALDCARDGSRCGVPNRPSANIATSASASSP